jgi:hypothetical protein
MSADAMTEAVSTVPAGAASLNRKKGGDDDG